MSSCQPFRRFLKDCPPFSPKDFQTKIPIRGHNTFAQFLGEGSPFDY